MAVHRIAMNVPSVEVVNADVDITVWSDEEVLGHLLVSKGSVDWRPGRAHTTYRLDWERFDSLMVERGTRYA
jgi:hypothetical protein